MGIARHLANGVDLGYHMLKKNDLSPVTRLPTRHQKLVVRNHTHDTIPLDQVVNDFVRQMTIGAGVLQE
jgi:hypothetical protein